MEIVDVKTLRGLAKIAGTMVSLAGATTMSLYRGAPVKRLWRAPIHIHGGGGGGGVDHVVAHESWVKGSLLALASCICWSIWIILQVPTHIRLPAAYSSTTISNMYTSYHVRTNQFLKLSEVSLFKV